MSPNHLTPETKEIELAYWFPQTAMLKIEIGKALSQRGSTYVT
jgi:hypothetical protein